MYTSARPSAAICRAAFCAVVIPMTRRPVSLVHAEAYAATVRVFPAPAGAVRMDTAVVVVSSRTAASSCSPLSPEPSRARRAMPSLTRGGTARRACRRIRSSRSTCPAVVYRAWFGGR